MKKYISSIVLALALLIIPVHIHAQNENVSVPKSMLTKDQLDQVAQKQVEEKINKYGNWVGIGHELGTAVNESLTAVTTQANNFANTPVGKLTAALVVWKVVGHDALGFVMGILEVVIILPMWVWSYRRFLPRQVKDKETFDPTTGKLLLTTYKTINSTSDGDCQGYLVGHYFMLVFLFAASMITMWS